MEDPEPCLAANAVTRTEIVVDELRLAMLEAASPEALRFHPPAVVTLRFVIGMMTQEQRCRLANFVERLAEEVG